MGLFFLKTRRVSRFCDPRILKTLSPKWFLLFYFSFSWWAAVHSVVFTSETRKKIKNFHFGFYFRFLTLNKKQTQKQYDHKLIVKRLGLYFFLKYWPGLACINEIKHFQQRMSWLPQRWRTQRNAIRHANCKIQWVIKTLNATCTSLGEYVC